MKYLNFFHIPIKEGNVPLKLITIGSNPQPYVNRPVGLPFHQIFMTVEGEGTFRVFGAGKFELSSGQIIIIPKDTGHEYFPTSKETWHLGFVGFAGELAEHLLDLLDLSNFTKLNTKDTLSFHTIWQEIKDLWITSQKVKSDIPYETSTHLYSLLLKLQKVSQRKFNSASKENKHIEKAAKFIRNNYSNPLKIQFLAELSSYSTQHFIRLFRKIYGMTPHQYLDQIRFERAKFLLKEGDLLVSEVASQVGIDSNYFNRLFKSKYGVTPGFYRKNVSITSEEF